MVTRLLLGNIIQMACFIFSLNFVYNLCGSLNRPSSKCYQKNVYHKSQSKKCQFQIFLGQTSFFCNISLLQSKTVFGNFCCHGNYNQEF